MPIIKGNSGRNQQAITMVGKDIVAVYLQDKLRWMPVSELTGYVMYYTTTSIGSDRPMPLTNVQILDKYYDVLDTCVVDSDTGYFEFIDRSKLLRTKYVKVETDVPHGGLSATSVNAIKNKIAGNPPSYWEPDIFINEVADVDGDGVLTTDPNSPNPSTDYDSNWVTGRLLYPNDSDWYFKDSDDNLRDWVFFHKDDEHEDGGRLFSYESQKSGIVAYQRDAYMYIWARQYGGVLGNYDVSIYA